MGRENLTKEELELRDFIQDKLNMTDEEFENTSPKEIYDLLILASAKERSN